MTRVEGAESILMGTLRNLKISSSAGIEDLVDRG
jgi:hypothetical protein